MKMTVDEYIERQSSPQREILIRLRALISKEIGNQAERMEWGVASFAGGKLYLVALKDRVHIGFSIVGLDKDEIALFEGSGKTARHIKIRSLDDIDEDRLGDLVRLVERKARAPG